MASGASPAIERVANTSTRRVSMQPDKMLRILSSHSLKSAQVLPPPTKTKEVVSLLACMIREQVQQQSTRAQFHASDPAITITNRLTQAKWCRHDLYQWRRRKCYVCYLHHLCHQLRLKSKTTRSNRPTQYARSNKSAHDAHLFGTMPHNCFFALVD